MGEHKPLNARPLMEPGESYRGYLLRLATMNGFADLGSFNKFMGPNDSRSFPHIRLSPLLGDRDPEVIVENRVASPFKGKVTHFFIGDLELRFPRVCGECLAQETPIQRYWGFSVIARCRHHHTLLVDTCPSCERPLRWDNYLFRGCSNCNSTWRQLTPYMSHVPMTDLDFESHIHDVVIAVCNATRHVNDAMKEIALMTQRIVMVSRPFDVGWERMRALKYSSNYSELVLRAYYAFSSHYQMRRWLKQRRQQHSQVELGDFTNQGFEAQFDTLSLYGFDASHLEDYFPSFEHYENNALLKGGRLDILFAYDTPINLQATVKGVAGLLGITPETVKYLIRRKLIEVLNPEANIGFALVDVRHIYSVFKARKTTPKTNTSYVSCCESTHLPQKCLATYSQLLALVLSGELDGFVDFQQGQLRVRVERHVYCEWARANVDEMTQAPIAYQPLSAVFHDVFKPMTAPRLVEYGFPLSKTKSREVLFDETIVRAWLQSQRDEFFTYSTSPSHSNVPDDENQAFQVLLEAADKRELHKLSKKRAPVEKAQLR